MWGLRARRGLDGIAAGTFGVRGAIWLPGVLLGVVEVIWFGVTLYYAVDLAIRSLSAFGLLDATHLDPVRWRGFTLAGPLFFWVVLAWSIASALIGTLAFRLTAAVMAGYQPFPAIAIGLVAVWAMPGVVEFRPLRYDPVTAEAVAEPSRFAFVMMVQFVFSFFATFGAMAADWGAASRGEDDVRWGGFVGVAFAATVLATLALLIVAGGNGRKPLPEGLRRDVAAQERLIEARSGSLRGGSLESARVAVREAGGRNYTVRHVLQYGLGGLAGGLALIVLNLALLGPACFAPYVIGRRLNDACPVLPRWAWSMAGAVATWPMIAFRWPARLEPILGLLGALFAPVVGALAADAFRHGGRWPGSRDGINPAGWLAWIAGVTVGLVPVAGPTLGWEAGSRVQPASVLAFAVAFVTYFGLAIAGVESKLDPDGEGGCCGITAMSWAGEEGGVRIHHKGTKECKLSQTNCESYVLCANVVNFRFTCPIPSQIHSPFNTTRSTRASWAWTEAKAPWNGPTPRPSTVTRGASSDRPVRSTTSSKSKGKFVDDPDRGRAGPATGGGGADERGGDRAVEDVGQGFAVDGGHVEVAAEVQAADAEPAADRHVVAEHGRGHRPGRRHQGSGRHRTGAMPAASATGQPPRRPEPAGRGCGCLPARR